MTSINDDLMRSSDISNSDSKNSCLKKRKVHFRISQFSYIDPELVVPPLLISNLFYTQQELEQIHLDNKAIVTCLEADSYCLRNNDGCLTRGLEDRTQDGAQRRIWNQQQSLQAVLREQERQRREGSREPHTISELHSFFSQGPTREARRIGTKDAYIARKAIEEIERQGFLHTTQTNPHLYPSLVTSSFVFVRTADS